MRLRGVCFWACVRASCAVGLGLTGIPASHAVGLGRALRCGSGPVEPVVLRAALIASAAAEPVRVLRAGMIASLTTGSPRPGPPRARAGATEGLAASAARSGCARATPMAEGAMPWRAGGRMRRGGWGVIRARGSEQVVAPLRRRAGGLLASALAALLGAAGDCL